MQKLISAIVCFICVLALGVEDMPQFFMRDDAESSVTSPHEFDAMIFNNADRNRSRPADEMPVNPSVKEFLTPAGRIDLEAALAAGYQGPLDLSGFDVRLDPESGRPVIHDPHSKAPVDHPDDIYWERGPNIQGVDDYVQALAVYGGLLIAGGRFEVAGDTIAYRIAAWDGSSWSPLGSGMNNEVLALCIYNDKLIAGGKFTTAGGIPVGRIAAWDGSAWASLGSGANATVCALTTYGGMLIAGGGFGTAGGVPVKNIAAWDGAAWDTLGSGVGGNVFAMTTYDNKLIAGGHFTTAGGVSASKIAAWDGAAWAPLGTGMNHDVRALTTYDNALIAGGHFTTAGGVSANKIAAWDGAAWAPLGAGVGCDVLALTTSEGTLFAGGLYTVTAWEGATWTPVGSGFDYYVYALVPYGGELVAGGSFRTAGTMPSEYIAAWDGVAWAPLWTGSAGYIEALTVYNDQLIAGGSFRSIDGVPVKNIAAWNGTTWAPIGSGVDGDVYAFTVYNNNLIVGGSFSAVGVGTAINIAAWNGYFWAPVGEYDFWPVKALTVFNGKLIAGAQNGIVGGAVMAWNGSSWSNLGYMEPLEPYSTLITVGALMVYDNRLIAAGTFSSIGGVTAGGIAAWDGATWASLGLGIYLWYAEALAVYDGKLIVGAWGDVHSWDGSTWSNLWSEYGEYDAAICFAVYDGELIMGGEILDGDPGNNIAAWDGSTWSPLGSGVNRAVQALCVYDDRLMAGGRFTIAGNKVSTYFGRWNEGASTAVFITGFDAIPSDDGIALIWSLNADERIEGFRIYRSRGDNTTESLLNEHLIDPAERRYVDKTALPGERYRYTLAVLGAGCGEVRSFPVEAERTPQALKLFQNHPNPFNPVTSIRYTVHRTSHVTVEVYSLSGELVRTLSDGTAPAGTREVTWDGTNDEGLPVAPGVYFYRLRVDKVTRSRKMVLLK